MSERDFSIGDRYFKLSKIDAFKQFHIVRRLGPILGDIIPVAQKLSGMNMSNLDDGKTFEAIAQLISPIMNGLSRLSDEDANTVLLGLLSAVEVQQSAGNWAKVVVNHNLMIQDMELPVMLQAAGRAFAYNLAGFFAIAPRVSHGGA